MSQKAISGLLDHSPATIRGLLATRRRVMAISDGHGGHVAGLTPPDFQNYHAGMGKFQEQQEEMWEWYRLICARLKPDTVFYTGDMVDGKGEASGGSELISSDWEVQVDIACQVIRETGAKKLVAVNGTPYHTGKKDDYENLVIKELGHSMHCKISGHEFPRIHQIQFDLKHKVGGSTIPHGRSTAIMKSKLWNSVWAERKQQPNSDVLIRGHVHYYDYVGNSQWLGIVMPALCGWGSKFGVRQCEGLVDFGLVWFDVYDGDTLDTLNWHWETPELESHKVKVTQI